MPGFLLVYNEKRASSRPGSGFHSSSARKMRLYHQCWIEFLDKWAEKTSNPELLPWADGQSRWSQFFLAGLLGDQQEADKYTAGSCVCHRCTVPRHSYLESVDFDCKTMLMTRTHVQKSAEGRHLPVNISQKQIVTWDADGRNVRPGPGVIITNIVIIVVIVIILIISFNCVHESNSTTLNEKKQDVISCLMHFGWCLTSVLISC